MFKNRFFRVFFQNFFPPPLRRMTGRYPMRKKTPFFSAGRKQNKLTVFLRSCRIPWIWKRAVLSFFPAHPEKGNLFPKGPTQTLELWQIRDLLAHLAAGRCFFVFLPLDQDSGAGHWSPTSTARRGFFWKSKFPQKQNGVVFFFFLVA